MATIPKAPIVDQTKQLEQTTSSGCPDGGRANDFKSTVGKKGTLLCCRPDGVTKTAVQKNENFSSKKTGSRRSQSKVDDISRDFQDAESMPQLVEQSIAESGQSTLTRCAKCEVRVSCAGSVRRPWGGCAKPVVDGVRPLRNFKRCHRSWHSFLRSRALRRLQLQDIIYSLSRRLDTLRHNAASAQLTEAVNATRNVTDLSKSWTSRRDLVRRRTAGSFPFNAIKRLSTKLSRSKVISNLPRPCVLVFHRQDAKAKEGLAKKPVACGHSLYFKSRHNCKTESSVSCRGRSCGTRSVTNRHTMRNGVRLKSGKQQIVPKCPAARILLMPNEVRPTNRSSKHYDKRRGPGENLLNQQRSFSRAGWLTVVTSQARLTLHQFVSWSSHAVLDTSPFDSCETFARNVAGYAARVCNKIAELSNSRLGDSFRISVFVTLGLIMFYHVLVLAVNKIFQGVADEIETFH